MTDVDILNIDAEIKHNFQCERDKLGRYREIYTELCYLNNQIGLNHNKIQKKCNELKNKIDNIKNDIDYNFYIAETLPYIEHYKRILNTPIKVNFMGKPILNNEEKNNLISKFINIVQKYVYISIDAKKGKSSDMKIICDDCGNTQNFDNPENNIYICLECGIEHKIPVNTYSYTDIDRVNISTKYTYDRIIHFRDCMNQYQGKQNCTIEQYVYNNLIEQFESHHLLEGDSTTPIKERCKNIKHDHITLFLKELGYTKHYENVNLIHHVLTDKKPDDIGYLEEILMDDFITLTELYDIRFKQEKQIERKSFINTQYVLYQLLCRHKHPCKKEDFNILKTIDRQSFHDEICKELFEELGWNHIPFL